MPIRESKIIDDLLHFKCNKCDNWKSIEEYYVNRQSKHGISSWCKKCMKKENELRYMNTKPTPHYVQEPVDNLFKNLGYDLKEDIHEQFKEKMFEKYGVNLL